MSLLIWYFSPHPLLKFLPLDVLYLGCDWVEVGGGAWVFCSAWHLSLRSICSLQALCLSSLLIHLAVISAWLLVGCLSSFSAPVDKNAKATKLKKSLFWLVVQGCSRSCPGRQNDRRRRQLVALHPQGFRCSIMLNGTPEQFRIPSLFSFLL